MRVVVTGGLGFIGSEAAFRFRRDGHAVTVVDSTESNVVEAAEALDAGIAVLEIPVRDYLADRRGGIDADLVVHAASPVGAAGVLRPLFGIADGMVAASAELGRICLATGARLVFISSSEVYGLNGVLAEDMPPQIPIEHSARVEYALGKLTSEAVLGALGRRGLQHVCIRPFNVVGARQSRFGGFVLPTFVQQALANHPITVFEDGRQSRAFLDVADLVEFIAGHAAVDQLVNGKCVNVGNPDNACTILELAERTKALLGSTSEIRFVSGSEIYGPEYVEAASRRKLCDIGRAMALGWRPQRSLDEIIVAVAGHYSLHRDLRDSDARDAHDQVGAGRLAARG